MKIVLEGEKIDYVDHEWELFNFIKNNLSTALGSSLYSLLGPHFFILLINIYHLIKI